MSEEIQQALSDLQHMHRLAARTRRWKRAAKYERRGRMFWHKHYYILRGHYRDAQELSERRTQQAAWLERCFGAATRRWREERQRADAAEARAKTWKHAARKMRSYKRAHRDWTEKTKWFQTEYDAGVLGGHYLGMHRADAIHAEVMALRVIEERADAAEVRLRDLTTKIIQAYMRALPEREYISPEQALEVLALEVLARELRAARATTETSEGDV